MHANEPGAAAKEGDRAFRLLLLQPTSRSAKRRDERKMMRDPIPLRKTEEQNGPNNWTPGALLRACRHVCLSARRRCCPPGFNSCSGLTTVIVSLRGVAPCAHFFGSCERVRWAGGREVRSAEYPESVRWDRGGAPAAFPHVCALRAAYVAGVRSRFGRSGHVEFRVDATVVTHCCSVRGAGGETGRSVSN